MPLASRTEFEDEVHERLSKLVVAVVEALLVEHVSILSSVMSKWPGEDGLVPRARRLLMKQLGEVMRETLDSAERRAKERKTQALARDLFCEVDLAVTRHLLELKRLGASEETVASDRRAFVRPAQHRLLQPVWALFGRGLERESGPRAQA